MYSRCSHCHTACEVSPEALAQGHGRLRCARCGQDFDALPYLSRTAPADLAAASAPSPQGTLDLTPSDATHEAAPHRTDALVDVLAAHADFIEPSDVLEPDVQEPDAPELETPAPDVMKAVARTDRAAESDGSPTEPVSFATDPDDNAPVSSPSANPFLSLASDGEGWTEQGLAPSQADEETLASAATDDMPLRDDEFETAAPESPDHTLPVKDWEKPDSAGLPHPTLSAPTPSFIPDTAPTPIAVPVTQKQWPRWVAVAALLLLLIGQSLLAQREHLAANASWRPSLERVCASLGCSLPAWHDPDAMHLMTRDVRPHPSVPDALLISASFRNDAPWAQQWPRLHLSLSDLNGQNIAQREFAPDQYLGMAARDQTIAPGQTASVALEVRDPGKQAVAFEFDFR